MIFAKNTPFHPLAVAPSKMTTAAMAHTGHAAVNRLINPAATALRVHREIKCGTSVCNFG
jgi:hypothetical protein